MSSKDTTPITLEQFQKTDFFKNPPKGYSYEFFQFKKNIISIWIRDHRVYVYNGGDPVKCIWGFFNTKTKTYHAPVNSSTVGGVVELKNTTKYSAMQINYTPLLAAFV
jgi:hypothetical protein